MPDVDGYFGKRFAGASVHNGDAKREWNARLRFTNIGAKKLSGDVVGTDLLLRTELADSCFRSKSEVTGSAPYAQSGCQRQAGRDKSPAAEGSGEFHPLIEHPREALFRD
jgi:hypothetical protein